VYLVLATPVREKRQLDNLQHGVNTLVNATFSIFGVFMNLPNAIGQAFAPPPMADSP
jgi:hypothetical protein